MTALLVDRNVPQFFSFFKIVDADHELLDQGSI